MVSDIIKCDMLEKIEKLELTERKQNIKGRKTFMDKKKENRYRTSAKVVKIDTVKSDLSSENAYHNSAFVEFTDRNGNLAKGSFRIDDSPLYTTIRVNSVVEIEYEERKILGGYDVILLNPERYKRVPTEEELAPYKRNNKRVMQQGAMAMFASFIAMILFRLTHSPLVIIVLCVIIYLIMKFKSKQRQADRDKFMDWHQKDEDRKEI